MHRYGVFCGGASDSEEKVRLAPIGSCATDPADLQEVKSRPLRRTTSEE